MKDYKTPFILAIVALFLPFFGVPEIYKTWVIVIIALVLLTYSFRFRNVLKKENGGDKKEIFIESKPENNEESEDLEIDEEVIEEGEKFEEESFEEEQEDLKRKEDE
jgi:hypothetical protein